MRWLIGLLAAAVLAGCSGESSDADPEPIGGSPEEVAEVVAQLERATRAGDFASICDELFAEAARERAGGGDCAELLRATAAEVRRPDIRVLEITIEGSRAETRVRTRAEGQAAIEETIELVREDGRWRITALGD